MQIRIKQFGGLLLAGFAVSVGILLQQCKPVTDVRCGFGVPAAVTVYSVSRAGGIVVVQDGTASKVELIGRQKIAKLERTTAAISKVKEPAFIDPRFGPSDADKFAVRIWANGKPERKFESYSCDEGAVALFAQEVFSAAKVHHRYQGS